jgi:hypothetical protein
MAETLDERAERLVNIGLDVAVRIRDENPDDVARTLDGLDATELRDMVVLLGAAIDVGVSHSVLYGWWTGRTRELRPCGTHAAAQRHRTRGEPLCGECRDAEREYDRVRKRYVRSAA